MDKDEIYGIKAVFEPETFTDLFKDLKWIVVGAIFLTVVLYSLCSVDLLPILNTILQISMTIVPIMVTLMLTAYTILLSIIGLYKTVIEQDSKGSKFIGKLNRRFASSIIVSVLFLMILFIMFIFTEMNIQVDNSRLINHIALAIAMVLIAYPIQVLIYIVIDLFNIQKLYLYIIRSKSQLEKKEMDKE